MDVNEALAIADVMNRTTTIALAITAAVILAALIVWLLLDVRSPVAPVRAAAPVPGVPADEVPGSPRVGASDGLHDSRELPAGPEPAVQPIQPLRFDPAGAARAAAARAGGLQLRVLAADGGPAAGAEVIAYGGGKVLSQGATDDTGLALLGTLDVVPSVVVTWPPASPFVATLEHMTGARELRLPGGAEIAGRIELAGGVPDPAMVVLLVPLAPHPSLADVPAEVIRASMHPNLLRRPMIATVEADRRFRFPSVPVGIKFDVQLYGRVYDVHWESAQSKDSASAPDASIVVHARAHVVFTGRVVNPAGRAIPNAPMKVTIVYRAEPGRPEYIWSADHGAKPDGSFELSLKDGMKEFLVDVAGPGGIGWKQHRFSERLQTGGPIGDLVTGEYRDLRFNVVDDRGDPVVGAQVVVGGMTAKAADEAGVATCSAGPGEVRFRIEAPGCRPAFGRVAPVDNGPIAVTLVRFAPGGASPSGAFSVDPDQLRRFLDRAGPRGSQLVLPEEMIDGGVNGSAAGQRLRTRFVPASGASPAPASLKKE